MTNRQANPSSTAGKPSMMKIQRQLSSPNQKTWSRMRPDSGPAMTVATGSATMNIATILARSRSGNQ